MSTVLFGKLHDTLTRATTSVPSGVSDAPLAVLPKPGRYDLVFGVFVPEDASPNDRKRVFDDFKIRIEHPDVIRAAKGWFNFGSTATHSRDVVRERLQADKLTQFICGGKVRDHQDFYCYVVDPANPFEYVRVCYEEFELCDAEGTPISCPLAGIGSASLRIVLRSVRTL